MQRSQNNNTSYNASITNRRRDYSLRFLLISNSVTIYFAIIENWNLSTVIRIYRFQSIIIGFFNFVRILQLKDFYIDGTDIRGKAVQPTQVQKKMIAIFLACFFVLHFGGFHFVYFKFLFTETFANIDFGQAKYIFLSISLFFINHLFSYLYHRPRDTNKQHIKSLMGYPYARILPIHLTIALGYSFGGALLIFLILKTFADMVMHIIEHNVLRKGEEQSG